MSEQTRTIIRVAGRCIIHVDDVNSPTGWWWGTADSFEWHDGERGGTGTVNAHITGPFAFAPGPYSDKPMYGAENIKPSVNYTVYPADEDTIALVKQLRWAELKENTELHRLRAANSELRAVLQSMAISPEKITEAVRKALEDRT